jgi:hypothetical protein
MSLLKTAGVAVGSGLLALGSYGAFEAMPTVLDANAQIEGNALKITEKIIAVTVGEVALLTLGLSTAAGAVALPIEYVMDERRRKNIDQTPDQTEPHQNAA